MTSRLAPRLRAGGQHTTEGRSLSESAQQVGIGAKLAQVVERLLEQTVWNHLGPPQRIEALEDDGQGQDRGDDQRPDRPTCCFDEG